MKLRVDQGAVPYKVGIRCTYNDSVAIILSDSPNNPSTLSN
jgi:hypothetical protein